MDSRLFSEERIRVSTSEGDRASKQKFESDRGRVLFSAPLRRMQSKAQVFSLESNAAVRSRLTHSLEVAHVGRYISQQLHQIALEKSDTAFAETCLKIEPIVETACLLHDIGNPPFGHLGEDAIKEWFKSNAAELHKIATGEEIKLESGYYKDIANFDGNPQGLRIAMTLQGYAGKKGFNLTYAQLGAILKYPKSSTEKTELKFKKIGVFQPELEDIKKAWAAMGLEWGKRHPLVYLMEASDDIAYSLSDIEDGIEKGIVQEADVIQYLREAFNGFSEDLKKCLPSEGLAAGQKIVGDFVRFRTGMINLLTRKVAEIFYEEKDNLTSECPPAFFDDKNADDYSKALLAINKYCINHLYRSPEAEDIELAGYNVIYGLLEKLSILLKMPQEDFSLLVKGENLSGNNLAKRVYGRLPKRFIEHYKESVANDPKNEWFHRTFVLVDYVSGMTDDFALQLYKLLFGIEVNVV